MAETRLRGLYLYIWALNPTRPMPRDDALNVWQVGTGPEKGIDFCDKVLIGGFCGITLCMIVQSHIDVYILYINTVYIYIHT